MRIAYESTENVPWVTVVCKITLILERNVVDMMVREQLEWEPWTRQKAFYSRFSHWMAASLLACSLPYAKLRSMICRWGFHAIELEADVTLMCGLLQT
jgi:hypothetical protein